jgi:glutathione S-transferase
VPLTLLIGNKRYSSWSMRPWIAMKVLGVVFDEILLPLYQPESPAQVLRYSPTGKVPALIDGETVVWETLAILDYLVDRSPGLKMWPDDLAARGMARAVSAEMHAGFGPLRKHMPMNTMRDRAKPRDIPADVAANVKRIDAIWTQARVQFGKGGPFLFGAFSAADAMYAPVVSRFASYSVPVSAVSKDYMGVMMALPAWQEWEAAAKLEPWIMEGNEV